VVAVTAAVYGAWTGLSPFAMLAAVAGALAAWDLDGMLQRIRQVGAPHAASGLVQRHLVRLGAVSALGLLLGAAALLVTIQLSFGLAIVLVVITIIALAWWLGYLRRSGG
jgi:hypothetical protein